MQNIKPREVLRDEISKYCRRLNLSQNPVQICEAEGTLKREEFLHRVLLEEITGRELNRKARLLAKAGFPVYKTLEGFEQRPVRYPSQDVREDILNGTFITEKRNLVFFGPVGTGKTHLAIALGVMACDNNRSVRFHTVTELILRLSEAHKTGRLERLLKDLQQADLIILDEWGYVPVDREGSQLLFRVIADAYETSSLIITTNIEFSRWGSVFTDDQMAAAMIDRLAHHGHLILFDGPSYRMEHALMRQGPRKGSMPAAL